MQLKAELLDGVNGENVKKTNGHNGISEEATFIAASYYPGIHPSPDD